MLLRGGVGLIIAEASHLITVEPSWTTAREEKVTEHAYDNRSSQLEYIKFYMGLSLVRMTRFSIVTVSSGGT